LNYPILTSVNRRLTNGQPLEKVAKKCFKRQKTELALTDSFGFWRGHSAARPNGHLLIGRRAGRCTPQGCPSRLIEIQIPQTKNRASPNGLARFLVRVVGFVAFFLALQEKIKDAARKRAARLPLAICRPAEWPSPYWAAWPRPASLALRAIHLLQGGAPHRGARVV
jgi:hypothetical protein